jgi:acetyl-CoA carboxylase biotin carboxyl carrier protein
MKGKKRRSNSTEVTVSGVDLSQLERLLAFMSQHGLEEFEYSHGDLRIRLKKPAVNSNPMPQRLLTAPDIVVAGPPPMAAAESAAAPPPRETPAETARAEDTHIVKSPIVGTYYSAPSPGAEPFVHLGDSVETGQVLCIVEAMKLMNEIESDVGGEILRIFVENGQPVEYGEPLFAVRPTRKK